MPSHSRRLGYTIFNLKGSAQSMHTNFRLTHSSDFLPLEAAIELTGNLLLSFKGTAGEKAKFAKEIFPSDLFSNNSLLVDTFSKVSTEQSWEHASALAMKYFASLDVTL